MRAPAIVVALVTVLPLRAHAQASAPTDALRAHVQAFQSAWNAHDAAALAALFTDDADQIMETGAVSTGRAAIQARWRDAFASQVPGTSIVLTVSSIRLVTPDVALINLSGKVTSPAAPQGEYDRGTQVMVRKGDQWLIAALRVYQAERGQVR